MENVDHPGPESMLPQCRETRVLASCGTLGQSPSHSGLQAHCSQREGVCFEHPSPSGC